MNEVPDVQMDRRPDIGFDVIEPGHHPYIAVPPFLLGYAVIAAVTMDDREGLLPRRHIVVLHDARKGEMGYSTHYVAFQLGYGWVLHYGHYDLSRDRALQDMGEREARER
jgi:hypothetical protein